MCLLKYGCYGNVKVSEQGLIRFSLSVHSPEPRLVRVFPEVLTLHSFHGQVDLEGT